MAREGITYGQIAAAADALVGDGLPPTIRAIRERLGTGSPNTVHRHLVTWRSARPVTSASPRELPGRISEAIHDEIKRAAAEARAETEARLAQSQAEATELAAAGEILEAERDTLVEQVTVLTTARDQAQATATERGALIERQAQQIEREQQAAEVARVELATTRLRQEAQVEKLQEQAVEIKQLRTALEASQQARQQAEQAAAVSTAKLEAAERRAAESDARETRQAEQAARIAAQARL